MKSPFRARWSKAGMWIIYLDDKHPSFKEFCAGRDAQLQLRRVVEIVAELNRLNGYLS